MSEKSISSIGPPIAPPPLVGLPWFDTTLTFALPSRTSDSNAVSALSK
jgi:hypothetical protein